jgi:hypothetical protein
MLMRLDAAWLAQDIRYTCLNSLRHFFDSSGPNLLSDEVENSRNLPPMHVYEVRPRKDQRGVDLISDALPFGRLWYDTPENAIGYAMHSSRSHDAVMRVYDAAGNVIETHVFMLRRRSNNRNCRRCSRRLRCGGSLRRRTNR